MSFGYFKEAVIPPSFLDADGIDPQILLSQYVEG